MYHKCVGGSGGSHKYYKTSRVVSGIVPNITVTFDLPFAPSCVHVGMPYIYGISNAASGYLGIDENLNYVNFETSNVTLSIKDNVLTAVINFAGAGNNTVTVVAWC